LRCALLERAEIAHVVCTYAVEVFRLRLGTPGCVSPNAVERSRDVTMLGSVSAPRLVEDRPEISMSLFRNALQDPPVRAPTLRRDALAKLHQLLGRLVRFSSQPPEFIDCSLEVVRFLPMLGQSRPQRSPSGHEGCGGTPARRMADGVL